MTVYDINGNQAVTVDQTLDSSSTNPVGNAPVTQALAGKADAVGEVTITDSGIVTQAIDSGKLYHFTGNLTSLAIQFNAPEAGEVAQYHFDFVSGSSAVPLTVPSGVVMPDDWTTDTNTRYEVDILNNYAVVAGWEVS